jgi:hypothetical protein
MAHLALQRVMVRMLYDPAFTDRVLADPAAELADTDLTDEERAWLLDPDPRAWRADPERVHRSLDVLVQQFPASAGLAARAAGDPRSLLRYFRSPEFHACMQEGGSMALAFGDWLVERAGTGTFRDSRVTALAGLERAVVALRRSASPVPPPSGPGRRYRLSPDKALHRAPAGTADLHEAVHRVLGGAEMPLTTAALSTAIPYPADTLRGDGEEALLLELVRDEGPRGKFLVGVAEITEGLAAVLRFADEPRTVAELEAEFVRLGADADEAPDLVTGFLEDGTLVPVEANHDR